MAQNQYFHSSAMSDDIYNATPQHTGVTRGSASIKSHKTGVDQPDTTSLLRNTFDHSDEKPPGLPPRCSSSLIEQAPPLRPVTIHRSKEHITAFMIPLPQPLGPDGQPVDVPQRYMFYLPPAPDHFKPLSSSGTKERKRDKCARKWQGEVRKAKMHSGSVVSLSGLYSATVRGAVYCLSLIQRSELMFLSRLPRKTLRDLCFMHPAADRMAASRRFEMVKDEFRRNKHVAKRDFWIGAVVLPFAQGVDIAIPIGGGFSEVTLVWMIITGSAWKSASGMLQRLVFRDGDFNMRNLDGRESAHPGDNANDHPNEDRDASASHEVPVKGKTSKWRKAKEKKPPVETIFRPSTSLDEISHYIQAACHARNPKMFPNIGKPSTEAQVLQSMGWAPEDRESEDKEGDVAWQIRKTAEDLKVMVAKAAKTWDKFCTTYVVNPEKALREEEKERVKSLKREEEESEKRTMAAK